MASPMTPCYRSARLCPDGPRYLADLEAGDGHEGRSGLQSVRFFVLGSPAGGEAMMSKYEARLYEAVRSLFPLEMKPIRGEGNPKTRMSTGAIRLESAKLREAEDLRTIFFQTGA